MQKQHIFTLMQHILMLQQHIRNTHAQHHMVKKRLIMIHFKTEVAFLNRDCVLYEDDLYPNMKYKKEKRQIFIYMNVKNMKFESTLLREGEGRNPCLSLRGPYGTHNGGRV